MQATDLEMRPPYIKWERQEIEDRAKTIETGHFVPKFVDYAHVTRAGQKDTLVKEAEAFIRDSEANAKQGRLPQAWVEHYRMSYDRWKKGTDADVDGTPIKGWGAIGASQQEAIIRAGVLTIEDLSQLPDSELPRIGMGAVSYKQKAIAFLATAKDVGQAAERIAAQSVKIEELSTLVQSLSEQLAAMKNIPQKPEK